MGGEVEVQVEVQDLEVVLHLSPHLTPPPLKMFPHHQQEEDSLGEKEEQLQEFDQAKDLEQVLNLAREQQQEWILAKEMYLQKQLEVDQQLPIGLHIPQVSFD